MPITPGTPWAGTTPAPPYHGTFIPEIWSGKLIEKFYAATVLSAIANTDYQGEIKNQGDTVHIRTKPTITIHDYTTDQDLLIERPSSNIIDLTIDYAKYFNEALDDVMELQSDINMLSMWADDASEQMKITIDTAVLTLIDPGVAAVNKGNTAGKISQNIVLGAAGSPVTLTPLNILDSIVDLGTVLDEQNIPESGRWLVIPPWIAARIKKSDLRNASISGDGVSLMRNGRLGMIDRFTMYSSNLLPTAVEGSSTAFRVFAGHPHGLTFASQITKMETMRSERSFSTLLRGLQVYGAKVLDGIAITELYAIAG
ncbi:MAG TPA: hypothetical protein VGF35_05080 [Steroidobacteraceae bacterium]|jgi:hypothetical protein